ncbi:MAG: hypothetical protein ACT4OM_12260 [Actinomycetota bacterium]
MLEVMKVSSDRTRKGRLKMRGLAISIRRFHDIAMTINAPTPWGDVNRRIDLVNILDEALVTIRILDQEVFDPSDSKNYAGLRESSRVGQVVEGLIGPRNNAVHDYEVIDPDYWRMVGPYGPEGNWAVFPRWKPRSEMPNAIFEYKGKFRPTYANAFDTAVSGRLIYDSLLDALRFFDQCDGSLAHRTPKGDLVGFPLPGPNLGYLRQFPDWPTHEVFNAEMRAKIQVERPTGLRRVITGRFMRSGDLVFCGNTILGGNRLQSFTEHNGQSQRTLRRDLPTR